MNKFIAASISLLMSGALINPAFAENSGTTVTTDTSVASSADLACMGSAVDARESVVLTARTDFNAKIIAALTARRASLKVAFTIAKNADRKVAIKAAQTVFAKAVADARSQYRTEVKAASKTFVEAMKKCNVDAGVRIKTETRNDHDNGRHLGQLKKKVKNGFRVNGEGKADLDLSF